MTEIARKAVLQDQPDTLALIDAAFGPGTRDILCNGEHVKGEPRYLSDLIEELAASRAAQARKQALQDAAAEAHAWGEQCKGELIAEAIRNLDNPDGEPS